MARRKYGFDRVITKTNLLKEGVGVGVGVGGGGKHVIRGLEMFLELHKIDERIQR